MAKIVRFHQLGGPEVLKIEEVPTQEPKKGEVRLRVKAIGLNRSESMFMHGYYLEPTKLPAKLGYEASGVVTATPVQSLSTDLRLAGSSKSALTTSAPSCLSVFAASESGRRVRQRTSGLPSFKR